jgi:spore photoproduct lyase
LVDILYIERAIQSHPRTQEIVRRFPNATSILIDRYTEVFNPKAQNFRAQKQNPALILAEKRDGWVLPVPESYGLGGDKHYYFSHMLNCVYDCRYCFLQGMYRSAHYLVFVNFEAFWGEIQRLVSEDTHAEQWFFSGYDCDSLAFEPVTSFAQTFIPFFSTLPNARLELRTKSTQIRSLLEHDPIKQVIIAYSLNPEPIAVRLEEGAPSLAKRLQAMQTLQKQGWTIGIRFDPIVWVEDAQTLYASFFESVFAQLDTEKLHSITLGPFRLPRSFYKNMVQLYPKEWLFAAGIEERGSAPHSIMSYAPQIEESLLSFCKESILRYIPPEKLFTYTAEQA